MAYKFQRGDFTASGSINVEDALTGSGTVTLGTATADLVSIVGAASFNDGNITNVGDIALDSISGDGDVIQIGDGVDDSVNFALGGSGNGSNYMVLPDNKASAWQFLNTGDETNFLTIKTTNGLDCLHTAVPISGTYFSGSAVALLLVTVRPSRTSRWILWILLVVTSGLVIVMAKQQRLILRRLGKFLSVTAPMLILLLLVGMLLSLVLAQ